MKYKFLLCKIDELWKVPREEESEADSEVEALTNILLQYKDKSPSWFDSYLYVFGVRNGNLDSFQVEYEKACARCFMGHQK